MKIIEGKLYKTPEICDILGITNQTLYKWINEGKIKALPHTRKQYRRILGKYLIEFMEGSSGKNNHRG